MKKIIALLLIGFIFFQLCAVSSVTAASKMPFTVMGQVTDRQDHAVKGATVKLLGDIYQSLGTTTSDDNGNFEFTNIAVNTPTIKVHVIYKDGTTEYSTEIQNVNWYATDVGLIKISNVDTKLEKYPPPAYGFIWGIMSAEGAASNNKALGGGVVYIIGKDQYYTFTSEGSGTGKGTFLMQVPVGSYKIYGQYLENGMIFQSALKEITVTPGNRHEDANPITVSVPMSTPSQNPVPSEIPSADVRNVISGHVLFRDGQGIGSQTVELWQAYDDVVSGFRKVGETTTDADGYYQFYDTMVTADPPNPETNIVFASKKFYVSTKYTDTASKVYRENKTFILYHPYVILGLGMEQAARNPTLNLSVDYSRQGWVKLNTDTPNARVYIQNQLVTDSSDVPVTFPYVAYLVPGEYTIVFQSEGYDSSTVLVRIMENQQTEDVYRHLDKSAFAMPSWVPVVATIAILLIVLGIFIVVLYWKRSMFMGPLAGVLKPLRTRLKSSDETRKAKKSQMTEVRKAEQARVAQAPTAAQHKLDGRKRDKELAVTAREQARLPEYRGYDEERPSMITARDIYKKQDHSAVERISSSHGMGYEPETSERSTYTPKERPAPEPEARVRVPKALPVARDQPANTVRDKDMVIRYIREHSDGVSFIQMSNDLEIPPNTLTIITKELVINDDIEKIKGLYYYKSHDSSGDEGKSSVVVWRLDGED